MIEFGKGTMTEYEIMEITKNYTGIRYKYNREGDFIAYLNVWTMMVDTIKKIKNK